MAYWKDNDNDHGVYTPPQRTVKKGAIFVALLEIHNSLLKDDGDNNVVTLCRLLEKYGKELKEMEDK